MDEVAPRVIGVASKGAFDRVVRRMNGDREKARELVEATAQSTDLLEEWATDMLRRQDVFVRYTQAEGPVYKEVIADTGGVFRFDDLPGYLVEISKRCLAIAYLDYMREGAKRAAS